MPQHNNAKTVSIYGLDGKKTGERPIPAVFAREVDQGLIQRAVLSIESAKRQPQGRMKKAGRDNTAVFRGARWLPAMERTQNVDKARLPRLTNRRHLLQGKVASVPQAVGGPRKGPKVEAKIVEYINKKEKKKALLSAIAATAHAGWVAKRHAVKMAQLPLVVEKKFEALLKTKDVVSVLEALHVYQDVLTAKGTKRNRAGRGKTRGRKYKQKKSILIVTGEKANVFQAARNLAGVDVVNIKQLNAALLAPGSLPGRLTLWTETAFEKLEGF